MDRRLEEAILGPDITPKQRVTAAFRAARTGNLRRLRWFHLVDHDDDGSADKPLKAIEKMTLEQAKTEVCLVLSRFQSLMIASHLDLSGEALWFFPKFQEKLLEYINYKVDWWAASDAVSL